MSTSTTASLCKVFSGIIAVLGGIGIVIYAFILLFATESFFTFLLVLLAGAFSVTLSALPLYALGAVLEELRSVRYQLSGLKPEASSKPSFLSRSTVKVSGKSPDQQTSGNAPIVKRTVGPWNCSCGQTNADTDQFCKNCGKYR